MSDLNCNICNSSYDLDEHLPLLSPCEIHYFCKACIKYELESKKVFTCPLHNMAYTLALDDFKECKITSSLIRENLIHCFYDQNPGITFNTNLQKALCETHSSEFQGNPRSQAISESPTTLRDNIIHTLIKVYSMSKSKLNYEFKRLFVYLLKRTQLQLKLNFLNALKAYSNEIPELVLNTNIEKNFELDSSTFQVKYKHEMFKNQTFWNEFIRETISSLSNMKIWYFTSVIKNLYSVNEANHFKMLIEIEYMKKNILLKITDLSCPCCGKGFQLGSRYPRKSLNCGHLICYSCSLNNKLCGYCRTSLGQLEPMAEPELFEDVSCKRCLKGTPISFQNLPYHSYCDCIYCESCIKKEFLTYCKDCLQFSAMPTESLFRISKKTLIRSHYMSTNFLCMLCDNSDSTFFSKKDQILICSQCFRGFSGPERIRLECQRLDITDLFEKYIQDTFRGNLEQSYPNFAYSSINRKLLIIFHSLNKQYHLTGQSHCFYNIRILRRFKTIYPVNSKDRRALKTLQGEKFEVLVETNRNIHLFGVIVGGSYYIIGDPFKVLISINDEHTEKEFTGKEGYVMRNDGMSGQRFHITISYACSYSVATGKYLKNPSAVSSQVSFSFKNPGENSRVNMSKCGPLLGLIYSDDA